METQMPERIAASLLRTDMADVLNRVAYGRERVVLERYGKDLVAVVPLEDLRLLESMEDNIDLDVAAQSREDVSVRGARPLSALRQRLGK